MFEPIERFTGFYGFLSNFYHHPFVWRDRVLPTAEHAFQGEKTLNASEREIIYAAATPGLAKQRGRAATKRDDWEDLKREVMLAVLRVKFADPRLKLLLLNTDKRQLIEGNTWGDTYWGVCKGKGQNHLGKLLMQVREELRG